MKPTARETWLAIGLLGMLVVVTILAGLQQNVAESYPALSNRSNARDGGRAFWLWLQALDFQLTDKTGAEFAIPSQVETVMMLEPSFLPGISEEEWRVLDRWVAQGGTLFLVGEGLGTIIAVTHFDFQLQSLKEQVLALSPVGPTLLAPPMERPSLLHAQAYFTSERKDYETLLAVEQGPVLLKFSHGTGQVVLLANRFAFSNAGLMESGNPELVLNLLAEIERDGTIWFDEWHHGIRPGVDVGARISGPWSWLRFTPAGRSLLYLALVAFISLALAGRNFGRPVPPRAQMRRRSTMEYVNAIANLSRRAGHRGRVLHQLQLVIKRTLGGRYRLDPAMPNSKFVGELKRVDARLGTPELLDLLNQLGQSQLSEGEMVRLAAEADRWLQNKEKT